MIAAREARTRLETASHADTRFEERVDSAIERACDDNRWPCTVALSLASSHQVAERVAERYRKSGWNVVIVHDPRDGDYMQLERP